MARGNVISGSAPLVLNAGNPSRQSPVVDLPADLAAITVRIQRPNGVNAVSWPESAQLRLRLVVESDGQRYESTIEPSGGIVLDKLGNPVEWLELEYVPRWGFLDVDPNLPEAEWGNATTKRLGQISTVFRGWIEAERITGNVATTVEAYAYREAAPAIPYHRSIAFVDSGQTSAGAGYGTSISFSHTAGAGSNRYAVVLGSTNAAFQQTSQALTYGGSAPDDDAIVNYTEAGAAPPSGQWQLTKAGGFVDSTIGSGAKTVQTTRTGGDAGGGAALLVAVYSGVEQGTSYGGVAQAGSGSGNPAATATGVGSTDVVLGAIGGYGTLPTVGANETARVSAQSGGDAYALLSEQAGADGGAITTTGAAAEWAMGAFALKAAATGTDVTTDVTSTAAVTTTNQSDVTSTAQVTTTNQSDVTSTASVSLPPGAEITGTATPSMTEADVVAGGKTIIITLTGGLTWED